MSFLWKKRWFFASKTEFSHNISEVSQIALENQTALVMLFFSKTKFCIFAVQYWKIRIFLNFFFIKNDLAWITAIFCFKNTIAFFCQILNFDLLMWSVCLTSELYDIGGSEGIIWSPPSSNDLVIEPLLASGGRKNHFFCVRRTRME